MKGIYLLCSLIAVTAASTYILAQPAANDLVGVGFVSEQAALLSADYPDLTVTGNVTVSSGNMTLTAGDAVLTAGDLTITAGDLNVPAAANLGITGESGANTACDTTCTQGCILGFDTGTSVFVACTDATADTCACAGAGS